MRVLFAFASLILPTVPGATNPAVTQANIHATICVSGYSTKIRPAEATTEAIKRKLLKASGYKDQQLKDYELDHLLALEDGGAPLSLANLWLEPRYNGQSQRGDILENSLHRQICAGTVTLRQAQNQLAAYKQTHG